MNPGAIVERARTLGVTLIASGGRIRYAPKSRAPFDLVEALRKHKQELLSYLAQESVSPVSPEVEYLLAWAAELAEHGIVLEQAVCFTEAPLRRITTERVSYYAARYLRTIPHARLQQRTGGMGRFLPPWWREREQDALYALEQLKNAMEARS